MEIFVLIMIFVLGLCLGSFVNMLIYRTAVKYELIKSGRDKSLSCDKNRSFCDFCGKQLCWYENVPVISWILQKGKSKCCHKKLSLLYPIVELATGGLFAIYWLLLGGQLIAPLQIGLEFLIIVLLVFLTVFDLKYLILPDFAVILLIIVSFLDVVFTKFSITPHLLSAVGAFIFLESLYLFTKKKGIGFGDVKLAIFMGLFLGWPKIIIAMYIAFIVGAIVGLVGIGFKKLTKKSKIAFGPFLILGTIIAWIWGDPILSLSIFQFIR